MSKKKFLVPLLIITFLVPQITFASWWNPFSWGWFISKTQKNTSTQNLPEAKEIKSDAKNEQGTTTRAYIVNIKGDTITLDYVDFYQGEEAQEKLIEDGECEKPADCPASLTSYYYRNKNSQERTFTLSQDIVIRDSRNRPQTVDYISSNGLSRLAKNEFSKNPNLEYRQGRVFMFTFNSKGEVSSIKDLSIP